LVRNVVYVKKTTVFAQLAPKQRKLERFIRGTWSYFLIPGGLGPFPDASASPASWMIRPCLHACRF